MYGALPPPTNENIVKTLFSSTAYRSIFLQWTLIRLRKTLLGYKKQRIISGVVSKPQSQMEEKRKDYPSASTPTASFLHVGQRQIRSLLLSMTPLT